MIDFKIKFVYNRDKKLFGRKSVMKDFSIGVNYWASNAGAYMWRRFDEAVVERDFDLLEKYGCDTVRIFPIWPDFQPVEDVFVGSHHTHHFRVNDKPLKTEAGLDPEMIRRFGRVLDLAESHGFKVIVSLITGWMSGRLFVPPFLANKNPLTDPLAIVWECKFIKEFISHFKDRRCIVAWEPGNECNCLTTATKDRAITPEQAELWITAISSAIRSSDPTRPVYSGLYSNELDSPWNVMMMADHVDLQTTHPYPLFTPYCSVEGLTNMRSALHSAAQSAMYSGVTGQGCLVEEIGTLGQTVISDEYAPEYYEKALWSSLQYGAKGFLWWCAFDQDKLDFPPYDGAAIERHLGLAYISGEPKELMKKAMEMKEAVEALSDIPSAERHAAVILTNPEQSWRSAYGAFCLAAQAGATVEINYKSGALADAQRYIIPSLDRDSQLYYISELIEKVKTGAKLLITYDGGHISPFEKLTGLKVLGRELSKKTMSAVVSERELNIYAEKNLLLVPDTAEVVLRSGDDILLAKNKLGEGEVWFFNAPLEAAYTASYHPENTHLCEIYKMFFSDIERPISFESDRLTVTYHRNGECVVVLVTSFDDRENIPFTLAGGYRIKSANYCENVNNTMKFTRKYAWIELARV